MPSPHPKLPAARLTHTAKIGCRTLITYDSLTFTAKNERIKPVRAQMRLGRSDAKLVPLGMRHTVSHGVYSIWDHPVVVSLLQLECLLGHAANRTDKVIRLCIKFAQLF